MSQNAAVLKMVHDLKSPLTALRILRARRNHSAEEQALLSSTLRLLERLLASCVGERGEDRTSNAEATRAVCSESVERQRILLGRDIILDWQAADFRLPVAPLALGRMVTNLVENAAAADRTGVIRIRVWQDLNSVSFDIIDEGPGLGKAPESEGWGVGTEVVRELVEEAGGCFDYHAGVTRGTRARLRFPIG